MATLLESRRTHSCTHTSLLETLSPGTLYIHSLRSSHDLLYYYDLVYCTAPSSQVLMRAAVWLEGLCTECSKVCNLMSPYYSYSPEQPQLVCVW